MEFNKYNNELGCTRKLTYLGEVEIFQDHVGNDCFRYAGIVYAIIDLSKGFDHFDYSFVLGVQYRLNVKVLNDEYVELALEQFVFSNNKE